MSDPENDLEEFFRELIDGNHFKEFVPTDEFGWNEDNQ